MAKDGTRKRKIPKIKNEIEVAAIQKQTERHSKIYILRNIIQYIIFMMIVSTCSYQYYFGLWPFDTNRSIKPNKLPKVFNSSHTNSIHSSNLFWGTYRPDLFFGVKHRSSKSLLGGLAWYHEHQLRNFGISKFRHFCKDQDGIASYGWLANDGENFGIQSINDNGYTVMTSWVKVPQVKSGGSWTAKIEVIPKDQEFLKSPVALMYYFTYSENWIDYVDHSDQNNYLELDGHTRDLGKFKISISGIGNEQTSSIPCSSYSLDTSTHVMFGTPLLMHLKQVGNFIKVSDHNNEEPSYLSRSVIFHMNCLQYPCSMLVTFNPIGSEHMVNERQMIAQLQKYLRNFDLKFDKIFPQASASNASRMYKYALSNMLGGMGYFYGKAKVQNEDGAVKDYWPTSLFTAVPSRSVFPRGFIWDEAFHHLLISRWNKHLTVEVLGSYLDLMNDDGWIPREIILGEESEIHVPKEFIVQRNSHANPPAWMLTVDQILRQSNRNDDPEYWTNVENRLICWLNWFKNTQTGDLPGSYRWRGRNSSIDTELNPKTLTSGLDDYPRASHPSDQERHVDLLCWLLYAERIMKEHFDVDINISQDGLHDLERLHWSGYAFQDYGLHSEKTLLRSHEKEIIDQNGNIQREMTTIRHVLEEPFYQFVPHIGYISLYPFLLHILPANSPYLQSIADELDDPKLLWSKFGIRSLAQNSSIYNKHNTQHDRPYWRGAIWLHFNYLTLRALDKYSKSCDSEQLQKRFKKIYKQLRINVLENLEKNFDNTNTVWEQYNDVDGKGQYSSSFTGWSALILLIRDELY